MELGDAKKNVPLAIVAVLAVGFAITRVIPSSPPAAIAKSPDSNSNPSTGSPVVEQSTTIEPLQIDPFSSIKLVRAPQKGTPQPATTQITETTPTPETGSLRPGGLLGNIVLPMAEGDPGPRKNTAEALPANRELTEKHSTKVLLKGIVRAGHEQAYLSIDGADAKGFFVGDTIAPGLKLKAIGEETVIVMKDQKTVTLQMNAEGSI